MFVHVRTHRRTQMDRQVDGQTHTHTHARTHAHTHMHTLTHTHSETYTLGSAQNKAMILNENVHFVQRYTLDTENLQSMALQLGCKARNVVTEIQIRQRETSQPSHARRELHRKHLSITVLSYLADMLATLKNLVSWLDR